jgi:hypothetical protein
MSQNILSVVIVGAAAAYLAMGVSAEQAPTSQAPAAVAQSSDDHARDLKYAEIYLKLARLDLQKQTDLQSRVQGSISLTQMERVRGLLRVAEENYRLIREGKSSRGALNVARAREAVHMAEELYKVSQQVNGAAPTTISAIDVERARLTIELERANLARAEAAARSDSPLDDLAWEIDQTRDELLRLRYRFEAITARR